MPLESRIQLKDSGIKLTIGIDKDVNPVPGIQGVQSRIQDCPRFPYTGRKIGSLLTSTLKSILFIQSCQSVASTMEIKSAGTFSVILVKVATPLLPPRTKLNFEQMGGNEFFFWPRHCLAGEWEDDGMSPKPIKKLTLPQVLLSSIEGYDMTIFIQRGPRKTSVLQAEACYRHIALCKQLSHSLSFVSITEKIDFGSERPGRQIADQIFSSYRKVSIHCCK